MVIWIYPGTNQNRPDHNDPTTCTTRVWSDQERYRYCLGFLPHGISEQPIRVPVQAFFFINASSKLGCTHGNGLGGYQFVKEQCKRCRGTKSCLRCPGTYQLPNGKTLVCPLLTMSPITTNPLCLSLIAHCHSSFEIIVPEVPTARS